MRSQYPDTSKAFHQLVRQDAKNIPLYRAQLRYSHFPQRAILGMTTAYTEVDEIHEWAAGWAKAFNADRRLWAVPESKPPTYRCACGDTWPDGTLGCGHTYTQCEPPKAPTPTPHPHAVPPT
ncbi:hypothetical protein AB0454_35685 [Streptomyces sp. NPDC093509]|uniref:hypothetical protein n=1 Tax=Streptomyces sp. NPDC093509 TaxID=3154982 RepID=UPI00344E2686